MYIRPLFQSDLKRAKGSELNIPVLYQGKEHEISDIHFGDSNYIYLKGAKGKPTHISKLKIIKDRRNPNDEIQKRLEKLYKLQQQMNKLEQEIVDWEESKTYYQSK